MFIEQDVHHCIIIESSKCKVSIYDTKRGFEKVSQFIFLEEMGWYLGSNPKSSNIGNNTSINKKNMIAVSDRNYGVMFFKLEPFLWRKNTHFNKPKKIIISKDGETIMSLSSDSIIIWNKELNNLKKFNLDNYKSEVPFKRIRQMCLSNDKSRILTNENILSFDFKILHKFKEIENEINTFNDGLNIVGEVECTDKILSLCSYKTLYFFDISNNSVGPKLVKIRKKERYYKNSIFSKDGKFFVVAAEKINSKQEKEDYKAFGRIKNDSDDACKSTLILILETKYFECVKMIDLKIPVRSICFSNKYLFISTFEIPFYMDWEERKKGIKPETIFFLEIGDNFQIKKTLRFKKKGKIKNSKEYHLIKCFKDILFCSRRFDTFIDVYNTESGNMLYSLDVGFHQTFEVGKSVEDENDIIVLVTGRENGNLRKWHYFRETGMIKLSGRTDRKLFCENITLENCKVNEMSKRILLTKKREKKLEYSKVGKNKREQFN